MTDAGQAFLFAGVLVLLPFAVIPLIYFADRLRSDFQDALNARSKRHARRWPIRHPHIRPPH
jgi:hypothetical protein